MRFGDPGSSDPAGRVVELRFEGLRSLTETAMDILRPLSPRETATPGVFSYVDASGRVGEVRLEGVPVIEASEIQQAVRTLALSAAIGTPEPDRREVLSFGNSIVPRTTNPYFRIVVGVVFLALAIFGLARVFTTTDGGVGRIVAGVTMALLAIVAIMLIAFGVRRWSWWTRARRESDRQGLEKPDQLKFWN